MTNAQEARIKAESISKDKRKELVRILDELEDKMQNAFAKLNKTLERCMKSSLTSRMKFAF